MALIGLPVLFLAAMLLSGRGKHSQASDKSPIPWNARALQTTYAGVRVRRLIRDAAVVFLYDIDNKSDSDYQLSKSPNVVVMSRLKSSHALSSEKPVNLSSSAFVPANNRTRIALEVSEPFNWPSRMDNSSENRFRDLVTQEVSDLEAIVIFDQSHRYQIDLPHPGRTWTRPECGAELCRIRTLHSFRYFATTNNCQALGLQFEGRTYNSARLRILSPRPVPRRQGDPNANVPARLAFRSQPAPS